MLQTVATRGNKYTASSSSLYNALGYTSATYRTKHIATANITGLVLVFLNQYDGTNAVRTDGPNAIRVQCSVVAADATGRLRCYFNGARKATIDVGGFLKTDLLSVNIAKGSAFYIDTYVEVDAGGYWPVGLATNLAVANSNVGVDAVGDGNVTDSGEGSNITSGGADLTAIGAAVVGAKNDQVYSPWAILGTTTDGAKPCVMFGTDSIGHGSLDFSNEMGYAHRALIGTGISFMRLGRGGETTTPFTTNAGRDYRTEFLKYATHAIVAWGRNDFTASTALATVQANCITIWTLLLAYGIRTWQTTITPNTTSTDNWATLANQTIPNSTTDNDRRVAFNNWVRDGAPMLNGAAVATGSSATGTLRAGQSGHPLVGYVEMADIVESARDSGKWAVDRVQTVTATIAVGTTPLKHTVVIAEATRAEMVGEYIVIPGAGAAGAIFTSRVTRVIDANTLYVWDAATTAVTAVASKLGAATKDGIHPGPKRHALMAVPVAALTPQFV